jgi:hypothetical protein
MSDRLRTDGALERSAQRSIDTGTGDTLVAGGLLARGLGRRAGLPHPTRSTVATE